VRIGNAQAFWGDRSDAAAEMLRREPDLDYLTLDYLAEVSMSILALQRERDPSAGFARDFVDVVRSLTPYWSAGGRCRLITNAGGLNPRGCAEACLAVLKSAGLTSMRIAFVAGDDVLDIIRTSGSSSDFRNLDTGDKIGDARDRLVTANAYLGADPIVDALSNGADIVITGRVADPSLVVAAAMHYFKWNRDEFSRLAGATVAGHLIECGTQVTGGISTDWLEVPDAARIGFPIAEVADDGSCIITKPRGTGGHVTDLIVKEQLLYEIGDPDNYVSPDLCVSFLSLEVEDLGNDRVRIYGAIGKPRPDTYKVSATLRDGFRSAGTLVVIGWDAVQTARRAGELILQRVRESGFKLRDCVVECLGDSNNVTVPNKISDKSDDFATTVLRVAIDTESRDAAEYFAGTFMSLITAGPQGTTGYAEGRPRIHPVFRYWPCVISRDLVEAHVELMSYDDGPATGPANTMSKAEPVACDTARQRSDALASAEVPPKRSTTEKPANFLVDIACARSGDKGINANVGIIARSGDHWEFLRTWLTADRVATHFSDLQLHSVDRFELPNLHALNFVLHGALRQNLRTDAQGKALGQLLLKMPLPHDFASTIAAGSS
jgi:hypothetical protein